MQQVTLGPRDPQMSVPIVQALGFHDMEIRPWDAAVKVGCHTVELKPFSCSCAITSKEVGSMQQVTLWHRDPQMGLRIVQALGFHKMEIRPWDAAVKIGCHTVERKQFSCSCAIISKEVGSMQQVTLGPRDPQIGVPIVQALGFHKVEIRPWDASSLNRLPYRRT